jgi:hypothetical protein
VVEIVPVLGESATAVEPDDCALDGSGAICWPPYLARRLVSRGRGDGWVPRFG